MTERLILPTTGYLAPISSPGTVTSSTPVHSSHQSLSDTYQQSYNVLNSAQTNRDLSSSTQTMDSLAYARRIREASIRRNKQALISAIHSCVDTGPYLRDLLLMDVGIKSKLECLDLKTLLFNNCKEPSKLQAILLALSILEKYGKNLIRPVVDRPKFWKTIKFANGKYHEYISSIIGAQDILKKYGYSVEAEDGLSFPDDGEPDSAYISRLLADILISKFEIDAYRNKRHPFPHLLEEIIPPPARLQAAQSSTSSQQMAGSSDTKKTLPGPDYIVTPRTYENVRLSPSPTTRQQKDDKNATQNQFPAGLTANQNVSQQTGVIRFPPPIPQRKAVNEKVGLNAVTQLSSHPPGGASVDKVPAKVPDQCDVCGQLLAKVHCHICQQDLCTDCDTTWHSHPRRKNHDRVQIPIKGNDKVEVQVKSNREEQPTQNVPVAPPRLKRKSHSGSELKLNEPSVRPSGQDTASSPESNIDKMNHSELKELLSKTEVSIAKLEVEINTIIVSNAQFFNDDAYHTKTKNKDQLKRTHTLVKSRLSVLQPDEVGPAPVKSNVTVMNTPLSRDIRLPPGVNDPRSISTGYVSMGGIQHPGQIWTQVHQRPPMAPVSLGSYGPRAVTSSHRQYPTFTTLPYQTMATQGSDLTHFTAPRLPAPTSMASMPYLYPNNQSPMSSGAVNPPSSGQEGPSTMGYFTHYGPQGPMSLGMQSPYGQVPRQYNPVSMGLPSSRAMPPPTYRGVIPPVVSTGGYYNPPSPYGDYTADPTGNVPQYQAVPSSYDYTGPGQERRLLPVFQTQTVTTSPSIAPSLAAPTVPSPSLSCSVTPPSTSMLNLKCLSCKKPIDYRSNVCHFCGEAVSGQQPADNRNEPPSVSLASPPNFHTSIGTTMKKVQSDPTFVVPRPSQRIHESRSSTSVLPLDWECEHCTFVNPPLTRVCSVCDKTSLNPRLVRGLSEAYESDNTAEVFDTPPDGVDLSSQFGVSHRVSDQVASEQDQIYYEKKAAHEAYQKQLKSEKRLDKGDVAPPTSKHDTPTVPRSRESNLFTTNAGSMQYPPEAPVEQRTALKLVTSVIGKDSGFVGSSLSPSSSHDATATLNAGGFGEGKTVSRRSPVPGAGVDLAEEKSKQELYIHGREMLRIVRNADVDGFEMDELDIALEKCGDKNAVDWLNNDWNIVIESVVSRVKEAGNALDVNIIGEISVAEARQSLMECKGNVEQAVRKCIDERRKEFDEVNELGLYDGREILKALQDCGGDVDKTLTNLNKSLMEHFLDQVWQEFDDVDRPRNLDFILPEVEAVVMDKTVDFERRARMVLTETKIRSWGRVESVLKIMDMDIAEEDISLMDIVDAVHNCGNVAMSLEFLRKECATCFMTYPHNKIRKLMHCDCSICAECLKQHFEVVIKEKHVKDFVCPVCQVPDIDNEELAESHLTFLDLLLQQLVDKETHDLFNRKLRDWNLMKEPNFRWCSNCAAGFIFNANRLKMGCTNCNKFTCFGCKKPWEDQHDGRTCEQFQSWKELNDPAMQAAGLAKHLEENGIDCPNCQFRYALARGGCMHFKCTQCRHEFCAGCYHSFKQGANCGQYNKCARSGLHCHHPRDCLYYLRDNTVPQLQKLLKDNNVQFDTKPPKEEEIHNKCKVMEQKDGVDGLVDEPCNKDVPENYAGLCKVHYTEYLVVLINRHQIDPVIIMDIDELKTQFERVEKACPKKNANETDMNYKKRLIKQIKKDIPLQHKKKVARPAVILNRNQEDIVAAQQFAVGAAGHDLDSDEGELYDE